MAKVLTAHPTEQARAEYEERILSLVAVEYDAPTDALHLTLSSGVHLSVPRVRSAPTGKGEP